MAEVHVRSFPLSLVALSKSDLAAHHAPRIIGISTARNTTVPVRVDILNGQPNDDFTDWDHVAEASLEVPSGQIVVAGNSDYIPNAKRLPVPPGSYRVRVYYGELDSISEDGLDGDDHYSVTIWPGGYKPPEVLKKWSSLQV